MKILIYNSRNYLSLLDLLFPLTSLMPIYNSRNYLSLLDEIAEVVIKGESTIVEII